MASSLVAGCGSRLEQAELEAANGAFQIRSDRPVAQGALDGDSPTEAGFTADESGADTASAASPSGGTVSGGGRPATVNGSSPRTGGVTRAGAARATRGPAVAAAPSRSGAPAGTTPSTGAGPESGGPGTGGATPAPKPEIALGSFGAGSGVLGAVTGTVPPAIRAWSAYVNSRGGLAGHPVRVIVADDQANPGRTQAIVRRMVEQDKVVAFFAHFSFTATGTEDYLESKGVPVIGGTGGDTIEDHSKMYFQPLLGADDGGAWAFLLAIAAQTDKKKMAVLYCREVSQCAEKISDMKAKLPYHDLEIVYEASISLAQPDYTAEMIQAQRAGAEIVTAMVDSATLGRLAQSAHRQNYEPLFSGPWNLDHDPTVAAGKELDGIFLGPARTPMYQTSPKMADYRQAMAQFQPKQPLGGLGASVFVYGKLLEKVLSNLGGAVTSESLISGLLALEGETLGGLLPGITFPPGDDRTRVNHCVIPYTLRGGKFTPWRADESFFCSPAWQPAGPGGA